MGERIVEERGGRAGFAALARIALLVVAVVVGGREVRAQGQMSQPGVPSEINVVENYSTGGLVEIVIPNMATGFQEKCLVYMPFDSLHLGPRPVLVVFHPFGQNHMDAYDDTDLVEECRARGWFLISPLGASKKGFSSLTSQANQEFVIEGVVEAFAPWVDYTRIYGIGFSMGAGDAAAYAARHLDPFDPLFAALFLHTGSMDKAYGWQTNPGTQWIHEFWTGGTPSQVPFEYERVSPIKVDSFTGLLLPGTHLGTNLQHVPNKTYIADDDPNFELKQQAYALVQYQAGFPSGDFAYEFDTTDYSALPLAHTWDTLDQGAALDWLAQRQLRLPDSGRLRVDVDDHQYWWFRVKQDQLGAFTDFDWSVDTAANTVSVTGSENLGGVRIPYSLMGFQPGPLTITTGSADGTSDVFIVSGLGAAPTAVLRNGAPAQQGTHFNYNAVADMLLLYGTPASVDWTVTP